MHLWIDFFAFDDEVVQVSVGWHLSIKLLLLVAGPGCCFVFYL